MDPASPSQPAPPLRSSRWASLAPSPSWLAVACLGILYSVWGSTYLAQRVAVETFGPLQMAGVRFTVAGGVLFAALRLRGAPALSWSAWRAVALSAAPLLVTGMGTAAVAISMVPSGLAALIFGSVPLWTSLFDRLSGGTLRRAEVLGIGLGLAGVVLVSFRGGLSESPVGALLLFAAAASYGLGCVATRKLDLPKGLMGTAAQMLLGGVVLVLASVVRGEPIVAPSWRSGLSLVYLIVLGSLVAYAAFGYLLRNVRPALATSYAFVNPIVALALGALLANERFRPADFMGLGLVLSAVLLVFWGARSERRERAQSEGIPGGKELESAARSERMMRA